MLGSKCGQRHVESRGPRISACEMCCSLVGLYRLQNIHTTASAAADGGYLETVPSFIGVRASAGDDVYATLRRIDASHVLQNTNRKSHWTRSVWPSSVSLRNTNRKSHIDASDVLSSRFGDLRFVARRVKCVVLDFSTTAALTTILRQVNQPPPLYRYSFISCSTLVHSISTKLN